MSAATQKDAFAQQFTGLSSEDSDDSYLPDDDEDSKSGCPTCGCTCSNCAAGAEGNTMSKTYGAQAVGKLGAKNIEATIKPVESEHPDGEFTLILSNDQKDRDKENLWADEWQDLPPKIHMDSDHAWAKGMSIPFTVGSGVPSIDENGDLVVKGVYAKTEHAQMTRGLVNDGHVWQASVSYLEHQDAHGNISRELLNGTITGVPNNTGAVITSSKSVQTDETETETPPVIKSKKSGGTTEGQYDPSDGPFGDPKNRKWPLNTRKHILNAWARIHQAQATVNYSAAEVSAIKGRIRSAARREGITLSEDKAMAVLVDGLNHLVKMKDVLAPWMLSQTTPGHTEAGQDVGAESVYDDDDGDNDGDTVGDDTDDDSSGDDGEDDNVLEWGDVHQSLAQACHDMACSIRDTALKLGAQAQPDTMTAEDWEDQGWGDKALAAIEDGHFDTAKILLEGFIAHKQANPGRPTGPYQGVEGMSGENASGTNVGGKIEDGQMFLDGTAGPAVEPVSKSLPSSTGEGTDADKKSASAPSPADEAARAKTLAAARLRRFTFAQKAAIPESEAMKNG